MFTALQEDDDGGNWARDLEDSLDLNPKGTGGHKSPESAPSVFGFPLGSTWWEIRRLMARERCGLCPVLFPPSPFSLLFPPLTPLTATSSGKLLTA